MDYIREELLRQRRVLAALLTGRETPEEAEDVQTAAFGVERAEPEADPGGATGRERGDSPAAVGRAANALGEAPGSVRAAEADGERSGGTGGPETAEAAGPPEGRPAGTAATRAGRRGRAGGPGVTLWSAAGDGGAVGDGGVPISRGAGPWTADVSERGAADARALSLVFQRDARRYDGGFSLY